MYYIFDQKLVGKANISFLYERLILLSECVKEVCTQ